MPMRQLPPLITVDDGHHSASIVIATAVLLFTALLFVGARLWVRYHPTDEQTPNNASQTSLLGLDDIFLCISTLLYAVHSVLLFMACFHGLGNSVNTIAPTQQITVQKLYYAANIFYVVSLGCSKASVSYLMVRINSSRSASVARSMLAILVLIALWTVAMLFAFIFLCGVPAPWRFVATRCSGLFLRWALLSTLGCCFEVAFAAAAVWTVWTVRTSLLRKAIFVFLFASRLPIIVIVAIQLAEFPLNTLADDPTLRSTSFICFSEIVLSYSICSANFPAFRRLTGDIRTDFGRLGLTSNNIFNSRKSSRVSKRFRTGQSYGAGEESDTAPINDSQGTAAKNPYVPNGRHAGLGNTSFAVGRRDDESMTINSVAISESASEEMLIRARTEVTMARS